MHSPKPARAPSPHAQPARLPRFAAPCRARACRPLPLARLLPARLSPAACAPRAPAACVRAPLRTPTPPALARPCCLRAQHSACVPQRSACAPSRAPLPNCLVFGHNTPRCIATQSLLAHCPAQVTIQNCIVTQFPSKPSSFTAIQFYVLQYKFSNPLPAIAYLYCNQSFQTYCNTISSLAIKLGNSSKFNFLHKFFFFRFF